MLLRLAPKIGCTNGCTMFIQISILSILIDTFYSVIWTEKLKNWAIPFNIHTGSGQTFSGQKIPPGKMGNFPNERGSEGIEQKFMNETLSKTR